MNVQFDARWRRTWVIELHFAFEMFVNEFVFSISILVFSGGLLILGTLLLLDAFRRLVRAWWLKSPRKKEVGVVLVVDISRPIENGVGDGSDNLIQRPLPITDK